MMYRAISRRLAVAGDANRSFGHFHIGQRNPNEGQGNKWLQHPSNVTLAYCFTEWALPFRVGVARSYGTRHGGYPFPNGSYFKLRSVTVTVSVLCLSLSVLVYRDRTPDVVG